MKSSRSSHSRSWWLIKNVCGLVLIAAMVARFLYGASTQFAVPILVGQSFVLIGCCASIWHYYLLKKFNTNLESPDQLLAQSALFKWTRHPMYLFDCVAYTGLFLMGGQVVMSIVLGIAYFALVAQARVEDAYLTELFPSEHKAWSSKTKLIIPLLY